MNLHINIDHVKHDKRANLLLMANFCFLFTKYKYNDKIKCF